MIKESEHRRCQSQAVPSVDVVTDETWSTRPASDNAAWPFAILNEVRPLRSARLWPAYQHRARQRLPPYPVLVGPDCFAARELSFDSIILNRATKHLPAPTTSLWAKRTRRSRLRPHSHALLRAGRPIGSIPHTNQWSFVEQTNDWRCCERRSRFPWVKWHGI